MRRKPSGKNSIKEKQFDALYSKLSEIYERIKGEGNIEVFGDLDFEVVDKVNNKKQRIAKLKGNKILIKVDAIKLPKSALKYVLALRWPY